jgi:DNA polymerase I
MCPPVARPDSVPPRPGRTRRCRRAPASAPDRPRPATTCLRDHGHAGRWIARAREQGFVAVDTETTALDEMRAELVGVSLCAGPGRGLLHSPDPPQGGDGRSVRIGQAVRKSDPAGPTRWRCSSPAEDDAILKIGQNIKYDAKIWPATASRSPHRRHDADVLCAARGAARAWHGHAVRPLPEPHPHPDQALLGGGKAAVTFDRVPIDEATPYAAEDADITLRLWQRFKPACTAPR